jgi:dehydrogenase/reductase SDR family protein 7B
MSLKEYYSGKKVWITGASSGIGAALSRKLVAAGAEVLLSARNEDKLKEVAQSCEDPSKVHVLSLDLSKMDTHASKTAIAIELMGHIDIMVHNGGISQRSLVKDTDLEVDRRVMEIDYFGTVSLTKTLLPHFIERQAGSFAVVTSLMGIFSSPMRSGYCGAKHALHGFFDALRAEHYDDNIHVNLLCPGFIHTDISKHALTGDGHQQGSMDEATGNGISPEACAAKMAESIAKNKAQTLIGKKEILGAYLHRFFPAVLRRMMRKVKVT